MAKLLKSDRFILVEKNSSLRAVSTYVLADRETGVNYLYANGGYGGGLTVLVDADGKPIVTPIVEEIPQE